MESLPVQIEWTVVPTTIQDEYEVKLNLEFGANIPTPSFGFVPPWVNIPKDVQSTMIVEAQIVNTGLIALTDVTAQIVRQNSTDTGISIVGGGYIGEIPAHGSVRLQLEVQKGQYLLPYQSMPNFIRLKANYVSFDPDTGLPENPAKSIDGKLPLYNPSQTSVSVTIKPVDGSSVKTEEYKMPEGQLSELDYLLPPPANPEEEEEAGNSVYEIVKLTLNQTATIERQAFDATLRISNGYPSYALQSVNVQVVLTDEDGVTVPTSKYVLKSEGVTGIDALDGTASLSAASSLVGQWQIIPMNGLGGDDPETGKKYYAKA
jgi:hypothetical protein